MNYIIHRPGIGNSSVKGIAALSNQLKAVKATGPVRAEGYAFRWGWTGSIIGDVKVINTAKAIHRVFDKGAFRMLMQKEGVRTPKTYLTKDLTILPDDFFDIPKIVRARQHAYGRNLHLVKTLHQLHDAIAATGRDGYVSDFIDKAAEYRVYAVSGKAIAVARKKPQDEAAIAWNHHAGAKFMTIRTENWRPDVVKQGLKALAASKLHFGAVDVVWDGEKAYVLEVNTAPAVRIDKIREAFARAFEYIIENGPEPIVSRGFIHPVLNES